MASTEIGQARLEIAVNLCVQHPGMFERVFLRKDAPLDEKERVAAHLLKCMMDKDRVVKQVLFSHYKHGEGV